MLKNDILLKIFNINNFDDNTIENCKYLELNKGELEDIRINKSGFEKINEYLKDFKYNFEELLYFLSLYGNNNRDYFNTIKDSLEIIIKNNKKQIFLDLEKTSLDVKVFDKISVEIYKGFININNISNDILYNITVLIAHPKNLYKDYKCRYYGLEVLMYTLFEKFKNSFEKWFLKSKNENLKLIFVSRCFDWRFLHIGWLLDISNIKSEIPLVKIINIMMFFKVDKHWLPIHLLTNNTLNFEDILKYRSISYQDKLAYLLYYVEKNFRIVNYENIDTEKQKIKELNILLNRFKNVIQNIDIENLNDHNYINSFIIYLIISKLKDKGKMRSLYKYLINERLKKNIELIESETWNFSRVLESNVYGIILKKIKDNELINEVKENFDILCKEANLPYFYYTNRKLWSSNISKMLYYLIVIFIFYKKKNKEEIKNYKNKFLQAKKEFEHFFDREQDNQLSVMKQILNQIVC